MLFLWRSGYSVYSKTLCDNMLYKQKVYYIYENIISQRLTQPKS